MYHPAAPAILTIDLDALCDNYNYLKEKAAPAECAAVVKANAYGIGAVEASGALQGQGCKTFFVAVFDEARELRDAFPDVTLYVLDGLFPEAAPGYAEHNIRPVLGSIPEIEEWSAFCKTAGYPGEAAIHIDTGMNRLGMRADEVEELADRSDLLEVFKVSLIISHLACGDEPGNPMNEKQRSLFDALLAKLPPAPACFANSAGVLMGADYHYDMVRPGFALYGGRAIENAPNPMKPVVRLEGRIAQIRDCKAGESVGYGATRKLTRDTLVATVATGYADGIFRHLGAGDGETGLQAWLDDHPLPVLGRVSMDTITLDATDVPDGLARRGALVELLGERVTVDDLAEKAGTIGYEVLTSLGKRYQRVYAPMDC